MSEELTIRRVDNGFVATAFEGHEFKPYRTWVATTPGDLARVVVEWAFPQSAAVGSGGDDGEAA